MTRNQKGQFVKGHPSLLPQRRRGRCVQCKTCGKQIWVPQSQNTRYCSKRCRFQDKASHSKWKGGISLDKKKYARHLYYKNRNKRLASFRKYYRKVRRNMSNKPNTRYLKGRRYEYACIRELKRSGFQIVHRSPQSRGEFDITGIRFFVNPTTHLIDCMVRLIQVKAIRKFRGFKSAVQLEERVKLIEKIQEDNFRWWGNKLNGKPKWQRNINFEIWIWENYVGWRKYVLNETDLTWDLRTEPEIFDLRDVKEIEE